MYCPNPGCIDFQMDGKPGEYVDTVTVCPKCSAPLVAELPHGWPRGIVAAPVGSDKLVEAAEEVELASPPTGPLVALAAFDYPDETESLVARLAANGIAVFVFIDDGRDFEDRDETATCARLLVPEGQFQQATRLLDEVD
jgi:hypothetical protein